MYGKDGSSSRAEMQYEFLTTEVRQKDMHVSTVDAKLQGWTARTLVDAVVVVAMCRHAISPSRR